MAVANPNLMLRISILLSLLLCVFAVAATTAQGNPPPPAATQTNVPPPPDANTPAQGPAVNTPPFDNTLLPTKTGIERNLSWGVLVFGTIVTLAMIWFLGQRTKNGSVEEMTNAMKYPVVLVIIVSSLFLVTGGYGNSQITPIIGLLGTLAGYILGRGKNN